MPGKQKKPCDFKGRNLSQLGIFCSLSCQGVKRTKAVMMMTMMMGIRGFRRYSKYGRVAALKVMHLSLVSNICLLNYNLLLQLPLDYKVAFQQFLDTKILHEFVLKFFSTT